MISPPTHRRARAGKGCRRPPSPAGHPARHRKRTVPSLRSVAVSNRMNPYRPWGGQHRLSLLSHRGRGTGAGGRPASRSRRKMTPNGPAIRPAGTIPSIHPDHSPGNSWPSAGIPEFPRGRPGSWPYCAVPPAGRARNLPARSTGDTVSRNNYRQSQLQPGRPGQGAQPPITAVFRLPQVPRHLRRKGLATNFTGFGAVRALKPDKTRIWRILKYRLRGRSTVMHRERHSGQPWRWIECSAGIGPHGAVAVIKVARRVLRSLSPSRWHWD